MGEGRAVAADGIELAYELRPAEGRPKLVLSHPLGLDRSVWAEVADRLAGEFEVLTYDCRGHGASGGAGGAFDIDQFAADMIAVCDAAGFDGFIAGGCSLGGCVAQAVAAAHPERVKALALFDTTAWYGPEGAQTWAGRAEAARTGGLAPMLGMQTSRWFSDAFAAERPDFVRETGEVFLATPAETFAATCLLLGALDLRGRLKAFDGPAAVVVGADDVPTPIAMAEALAAGIPRAELTVIPGARHLAPMERPDLACEALRRLA